jgi:hypothetical protein
MWRRLADKTIARIGLPLERVSDKPPFRYERRPRPELTLAGVEFVVVPDGPAQENPSAQLAGALARGGVSSDAIHVVEGSGVSALSRCLEQVKRPVICLISASLELSDAQPIELLLREMDQANADLAAPRLVTTDGNIVWADPGFDENWRPSMAGRGARERGQPDGSSAGAPWLDERLAVIRREVVNAVGGIDDGYDDRRIAFVDLCLKARQRQFTCAYIDTVSVVCRADGAQPPDGDAMNRLRSKWTEYPKLFE